MQKSETTEKQTEIDFQDIELARQLFGEHNTHLKNVARKLHISVNARGKTVFISGDSIAVELAENLLGQLYALLEENTRFMKLILTMP